jgi:hypothetical protein
VVDGIAFSGQRQSSPREAGLPGGPFMSILHEALIKLKAYQNINQKRRKLC